jgi:hypothetical protein
MAATESDTNAVPESARYPPYVRTDAEKERWDIVRQIAERYVELYEDEPDPSFVWYATRQWYFSDIPTGSPDDPPSIPPPGGQAIAEADSKADVTAEVTGPSARAQELFADLQASKPAPGSPPEEWQEHVGKVADLLDELLGDPDEYDFGDDEIAGLDEAVAGVIHGAPYKELLHPRDRLGKWSQKLNGLQKFVTKNRDGLKQALAVHVAAARIRIGARAGKLIPKASGEDLAAAHEALRKGTAGREHFLALAHEERARHGVSGAKRQVEAAQTQTMGEVLRTLAFIYSEKGEEKFGPLAEPSRDALAMQEWKDRAEVTGEQAHRLAEYAMEHHRELGALLRASAWHIARVKGLVAAEIDDDDVAEAEPADVEIAEDVLIGLGFAA